MMNSARYVSCFLFLFLINALRADVNGADPRLTGAPGDQLCVNCHSGGAANSSAGWVKILLPGDAAYTPGVKQRIQVEVADPSQRRWGFELTARLASSASSGQAGQLATANTFAKVVCENGRQAPCSTPSVIQFATHTTTGTRAGTTGSVRFDIDWTPPDTDMGPITLYAAGNAANGDGRDTGDHIYNTSVELKPAVVVPKPTILTENGVVNAANAAAGIAPGSWITIKGKDLAATTRTWTAASLADGAMPASLDDVSVTVNGKSAYVESVSPTQLNVLTPADDAAGPVEVRVTFNGQTSDAAIVNLAPAAPALFTTDGKNLALAAGDNALLDQSARFFASDTPPPAVKPLDPVTLFGTGFGVNPDLGPVTAMIGGTPANVISVELAEGLPRITKVTVEIPESLADGVYPVVVTINGVNSPDQAESNLITVARPQ